jgi:predicted patatin/cPLA2 family phospholipase
MLKRRAENSQPGQRADNCKLGVAVEGGGIRGVVSAAMLCALEDLGFDDVFDDIYACSSGAINASYFLNRRTWFPLTIYFDDLTTGEFLDFRRLLRGQAPMDIDFVFDEVLEKRKPLGYQKIIDAPQPLHVMVTDVDHLRAVVVADFREVNDLRSALRASAWLPLATKGTTQFRDYAAIDGGIIRFHPYRAALDDNCTHILSLSTRPIGPPRSKVSLMNRYTMTRLEKMRAGLGDRYISGVTEYLTKDRPFLAKSRKDLASQPSVLDIAPNPGTAEVKRNEQDRRLILDGAAAAFESIYEIFELRDVSALVRFDVVDRCR